jgi:hypothetical protein
MRVAEENKERPPFDISVGDWLAVLVDQLERTTYRRSALPGTPKVPRGIKKNTCENNQAGYKGRQDQQNL